jgi:hypothetical protein
VSRLRREDWAGAAVALGGLGLIAVSAVLLRSTHGGDPSIYLSYSRNFADGHIFEFNPGEFSSGSTSPLWAAILALPYLLGLGATGAKVLGAAFTCAAFALSVAAAARATGSLLAAAVAGLYVVVMLTLSGLLLYESALIVALVALSVLLGLRLAERRKSGEPLTARELVPLALVWAAIPLSRPDAVLLVVIQIAALWWFAAARDLRDLGRLLAAAAAAAIPALAYYAYSLIELGTPSTSSQGRAFQFQELADHRLGALCPDNKTLRFVCSRPAIWGFLAAFVGVAVLVRRGSRWLALYAAGAIAAYLLVLTFVTPGDYDTSRYLLPLAPLVVVAAAAALRAATSNRLALVLAGVVAVLLGVAAVDVPVDARNGRDGDRYSLETVAHKDAAAIVNARAARGDVVLAYEVQVRYWLRDDLSVLSLDGITDGKVADYAERDIAGFLRRYRPRLWIIDTSTDRGGRPYLGRSVLGTAARRLADDPSLQATTAGGFTFRVVERRRGPLPYRFGAWRMVVEIDYGAGPRG